jgi:methionyl aminopeptidase
MIVRKTPAELEKMRQSGLLVWNVLKKLGEMAVEGVSTLDLEIMAEKMIADAGAKPAFKGYFVQAAGERYRFVLCTSINEEIVHGCLRQARFEVRRYRLDRYGSRIERLLRRFGPDGAGRAK